MKELKIKWQRLISGGETCPRCGGTEEELEKAVSNLKQSLNPLGVSVVLDKRELSEKEFKETPLQSNMIIINDQPLENWIDGEIGKSQCCDVCGPTECRTITVEGKTFEEIPAELIVKGGLAAASNILDAGTNGSCCNNSSSESSCC